MNIYSKNRFFFLSIFLLVGFMMPLLAAPNETLPTYHWAYDYLYALQLRGFCLDLGQMNLPYTRGAVARSLAHIQRGGAVIRPNSVIPVLLARLQAEFAAELAALNSPEPPPDEFLFRANLRSNLDAFDNSDAAYFGIYRSGIGARITKNLFAWTSVIADQYDYDDPDYSGYKWRGLVGYIEQAYVNVQWKKLQLKFGRDFLKWGLGESGALLFSNICHPMDQFIAAANFGPFKFTFMTAELNRMNIRDDDSVTRQYRRFLSGHRLDASFWRGRVQVGISEVIIYGEANGGMNLINLNPMIFYHLDKKNGAVDNNVLPTIDALIYPAENWRIYSSILIDDVQVEKTVVSDLEPDEIGLLFGTTYADPFGIRGLVLGLEYVQIANRTYKTPHPHEIFTYRNQTLGHPLESDFYHWQMSVSGWLVRDCRVELQLYQTRAGEGSLDNPWDEPWENFTLETGYHEPFPTGIIQTSTGFEFKISWLAATWLRLNSTYRWHRIGNRHHVEGQSGVEWRFNLSAELSYSIHRTLPDSH